MGEELLYRVSKILAGASILGRLTTVLTVGSLLALFDSLVRRGRERLEQF